MVQRIIAMLSLSLLVAACESTRRYAYRPAVSTSAVLEGHPAALHRIPPNAPAGDVRIATLGLADIRATGEDEDAEEETRALHLRMVVSNDADVPWSLDTREQRVALPGDGDSPPAYATADGPTPPIITIPPRGKRTVDLFYPLPQRMQEIEELPSFDTIWRVETHAGPVVQRTPFERVDVTPVYRPEPYYYYHRGYGWGYWPTSYWYDPWYPQRGAFIGVDAAPRYGGHPVMIDRHPTRPPPARRVR
jgi:hypothetical protein